jgi:hypothetical protein
MSFVLLLCFFGVYHVDFKNKENLYDKYRDPLFDIE